MQRLRIRRRPGTIAVAAAIQRHYDIHVVPHILCSGYTREDTEYMLLDLQFLGISDLLVLRGDKAKEDSAFRPTGDGYSHATEPVSYTHLEVAGRPCPSVRTSQASSFSISVYTKSSCLSPPTDKEI